MTLYASLGQVRISVAALAADFVDEVGGHLHKKADRAYTKAGPYTTTTIPISPYLAWGVFRCSNEILLDSTEAVQSFLGPYWRRKIFCKGSVARFIEPLHLKWLPAKRQLRIKFNYATYNDQGELQTDGRASTPANSYSILVQNNEAGSNQPLLLLRYLWEGPYRHWPPSPPLPLLPVEQGGCAGAASLSGLPLLTTCDQIR